jgi:8-oxo-dGTP pyrophosphatase MutT (NUDIX family)
MLPERDLSRAMLRTGAVAWRANRPRPGRCQGRLSDYTPDGRLDTVVRLPARQVTSAAFGGDDLGTLYITTARRARPPPTCVRSRTRATFSPAVPASPRAVPVRRLIRSTLDRLPSHPVTLHPTRSPLATLLDHYQPEGEAETADLRRVRALAETAGDPWWRELPLHLTASALILHPPTARVLLRWHQRQQAWLQVGGHGDLGESDPLAIARREAGEETGLADLAPWPDAQVRHMIIVGVPPGNGEPAHEHADIRYFMATQAPDAMHAESKDAPLRWLSMAAARRATSEANLKETLARLERLLALSGW